MSRKNEHEGSKPRAYNPADDVDEGAPTTAQNPADLNPDDSISTLETVQENARAAAGEVMPGDAAYEEPRSRKNRKTDKK